MSIESLQFHLAQGHFSSEDLVRTYLGRIDEVNSQIHAVAEVNRDAIAIAQTLDHERSIQGSRGILHGIPVLVKDSISSVGMNNTAGSYCLVGAKTKKEASLITRLRKAGAIILGKANMSEWGNSRSSAKHQSNGWSAWQGQTFGVYHDLQDPCGSSSGSGVALTLGLAAATIGVETVGSLVCPAAKSNVVAIKPTAGLVANDNIVVTRLRGTAGPMAHSIRDAAILLEWMVDPSERNIDTQKIPFEYVPGYNTSCNDHGLRGKRIGIPRNSIENPFAKDTSMYLEPVMRAFEQALIIMRRQGATIIDNANYTSYHELNDNNPMSVVGPSEYKHYMEVYFSELEENPNDIHKIEDMIRCTQSHPKEDYSSRDTEYWEKARAAVEFDGPDFRASLKRLLKMCGEDGIDGALKKAKADALVYPTLLSADMPGFAGYPIITVPLGFMPAETPVVRNARGDLVWDGPGIPFGLAFIGAPFSEALLIELAHAFETATKYSSQQLPSILPRIEIRDIVNRKA
ncbi:glutamyl-tRNA amidotransferase subunit A [Exophiala viscosa]|uniref:Glutamyl-tRNA amidotransferase subunit A n=2 Tax=Exophiala viscosa TaxID=2486360 RepID=A0AAN6E4K5_9EURO|nr:glutamyl-tRNA amidotransferase subunit A [Exophiala viscosa]